MKTLFLVLVFIGVVNAAGKCNCGQYGNMNNQVAPGQNFRGLNLPGQLPVNNDQRQGNFGLGGNNVRGNTRGKWFGKTQGSGGISGGTNTNQIIDTGGLIGQNGVRNGNFVNGAINGGMTVNNVATVKGATAETGASTGTGTTEVVSNGGMTGNNVVTQNGGITTGTVSGQNGGTSVMNGVNDVSRVNGGITAINGMNVNGVSSQSGTITSGSTSNGVVSTGEGQTDNGGMTQTDISSGQITSINGGDFTGNGVNVGIGGVNQGGMTNGIVQGTSVTQNNKRLLKTFGRRMPSTDISGSTSMEAVQTFNGDNGNVGFVNGITPTVSPGNGVINGMTNQVTNTEQIGSNIVAQNGNIINGGVNNQGDVAEQSETSFVTQNGNGEIVSQGGNIEQTGNFVNQNGNLNNGGFVNVGVAGTGIGSKRNILNNMNMPTMNIPTGKQPQLFGRNTGTVSNNIMGIPQQGPGLKKQGINQSGQNNIGVGGFAGQNIGIAPNVNNIGISQQSQQASALNQQNMNQVGQNIVNGGIQGQGQDLYSKPVQVGVAGPDTIPNIDIKRQLGGGQGGSGNQGMVSNQGIVPQQSIVPGGYGGQQPVIVKTGPGTGGIGGVIPNQGNTFTGLRQQAYNVIKIIQGRITGNQRKSGLQRPYRPGGILRNVNKNMIRQGPQIRQFIGGNGQRGPGFNRGPRGNMFHGGRNAGMKNTYNVGSGNQGSGPMSKSCIIKCVTNLDDIEANIYY
ncbi:hypothetical protein ACF0H5_021585 [Mactra antiquata]